MKHKSFFITLLFLHGSLNLCGVESAGGIVGTGGGVAESEHYKTVGVIGQVLGHPLVENHVVTNLGGYIPTIFPCVHYTARPLHFQQQFLKIKKS